MSNQTLREQRALKRAVKFNNHPRHLLGSKPADPAGRYVMLALLDLVCVAVAVWRCV